MKPPKKILTAIRNHKSNLKAADIDWDAVASQAEDVSTVVDLSQVIIDMDRGKAFLANAPVVMVKSNIPKAGREISLHQ